MVAIEAKGALTPRQLQLLVALSAVGILLRFAVIDRSYWFDELATLVNIDAPDWKTVLDVTSKDNQPPLYNSTVFAWIHAFGYSEVAVRALSALYGLIALFTPWLARRSLTQSQKPSFAAAVSCESGSARPLPLVWPSAGGLLSSRHVLARAAHPAASGFDPLRPGALRADPGAAAARRIRPARGR